ncbi:MAG TPA: polysaccharide deacetylase family protein [Candidatus Acidoferrales bacterium]|jgi:peptidoglycan/xylan/chitin deacetylase (PgdA/CDA1 family)
MRSAPARFAASTAGERILNDRILEKILARKTRAPAPAIYSFLLAALLCSTAALPNVGSLVGAQSSAEKATQRTVAITVDDLPGAEPGTDHAIGNLQELERINHAIPAALRAHRVPGIGFVNEWKLQVNGQRDARAALLQVWLDAGMSLGNHTYSHPDFQTTPLDRYEDETIRGEVVTRALMSAAGQKEKYFRHPFLNTGPTAEAKSAFESFLKDRGYRVAPVTVDPSDYMFNDILGESIKTNDKQPGEKAKKEYFAYIDTVFAYEEQESRNLFQREIPQVLLIHDSELNAQCLDALLTQLERRGYRFISLDDALADPAYATPDLFVGGVGISWLTRWKLAFGQKPDYQNSPDPPKWVQQGFEEIRSAHAKSQ